MRRICDILLVFAEADIWDISQDAAADADYNMMIRSGGMPGPTRDTLWRAGKYGCVCGKFDIGSLSIY